MHNDRSYTTAYSYVIACCRLEFVCFGAISGVPRNFVRVGEVSTNLVEDRGERERGSEDGSPPS